MLWEKVSDLLNIIIKTQFYPKEEPAAHRKTPAAARRTREHSQFRTNPDNPSVYLFLRERRTKLGYSTKLARVEAKGPDLSL